MPGTDERFSDEIDPATGEVRGPLAADGTRRMPTARTFGQLMTMLGGGFEADLMRELADAVKAMEDMGRVSDRKVKAGLKLSIEINRDADGIFFLLPSFAITLPKPTYSRSIAWATADGLSPNKPQQAELFGQVRVIDGTREIRN